MDTFQAKLRRVTSDLMRGIIYLLFCEFKDSIQTIRLDAVENFIDFVWVHNVFFFDDTVQEIFYLIPDFWRDRMMKSKRNGGDEEYDAIFNTYRDSGVL